MGLYHFALLAPQEVVESGSGNRKGEPVDVVGLQRESGAAIREKQEMVRLLSP